MLKKEVDVFDQAGQKLNSYWNGTSYDSFPVSSRGIPCSADLSPYNCHPKLVAFCDAGITKIRTEEQLKVLRAELTFLLRHARRSSYTLQFLKCEDVNCHHCATRPIKATEAMGFLRSHGNGDDAAAKFFISRALLHVHGVRFP